MAAAIALGERGRGRTAPNPNVGCVIVQDDKVVGRGWTQQGGRPHAEAMALEEAGAAARGAAVYVTLEPCAHVSRRGPACATLLAEAGPARVVIAVGDPDPRTNGLGIERLESAGVEVLTGPMEKEAERSMAGFFSRIRLGRPFVTLKLAMSIDGRIALASGESKWITGEEARAHAHLQRALSDMILVGRGTYEADDPRLDVRLPGLEDRSPRRALLTTGPPVEGWTRLSSPQAIRTLADVNDLLVEGGAETASSFLHGDLVDRLLIYRAPILIGAGKPALTDIGLDGLAAAHGRWRLADTRPLGSDTLEVYERTH
ncbi:MAG TPA: bifunctional diaminohydroxyphosphoribosylaminopyrimidine deaminase/5-amino-6-(5-phosphoribosylamino)uracil reductase RibD [Allosphingosinicella sp.]|jgi:diaminohydroxyphosphoribosylaminopyrimidine deaminase/5-amino-6-(5-phosphoribosylamino)uracil reductase|nr:bifunctional diaminohydroxyphosphoribosylaminopyrimidine deaminase/5-amino-6-(5-phosphoribosylamino)uracil reductase RibD [Allosphingosinicella sp.]